MNSQQSSLNKRFIIIDGPNVARQHGTAKENANVFSFNGIKLAVDYFLKHGHKKIKVILPRNCLNNQSYTVRNPEIYDYLEAQGMLTLTPSKSYDDRFIVESAHHFDGVIFSNDNYQDLLKENREWKDTIEKKYFFFVVLYFHNDV
jgi:hypothetical protein